jgi:hypothetical protein
MHWGCADGATSATAWGNTADLGQRPTGPFSAQLNGLAPHTRYYYRASAQNVGGLDWAPASDFFDTPAALPTLVNAPATGITAISATLGGTLLATGGEDPIVRIHWGASDAGTSATLWGHVEGLGVRAAGPFSAPIAGLSPNVTYYFRVSAPDFWRRAKRAQ